MILKNLILFFLPLIAHARDFKLVPKKTLPHSIHAAFQSLNHSNFNEIKLKELNKLTRDIDLSFSLLEKNEIEFISQSEILKTLFSMKINKGDHSKSLKLNFVNIIENRLSTGELNPFSTYFLKKLQKDMIHLYSQKEFNVYKLKNQQTIRTSSIPLLEIDKRYRHLLPLLNLINDNSSLQINQIINPYLITALKSIRQNSRQLIMMSKTKSRPLLEDPHREYIFFTKVINQKKINTASILERLDDTPLLSEEKGEQLKAQWLPRKSLPQPIDDWKELPIPVDDWKE